MGAGPMTGRAVGYCADYGVLGYADPAPGRGFSMGRGGGWRRGRRWRHWHYATGLPGWARFGHAPAWRYEPCAEPLTREQEVESLKTQAGWLKEQLDAINQCLTELEKEE